MALDIVLGLVAVLFGTFGWQNGFSAQLGRLVVAVAAAAVAKLLAMPTGRFIVSGVEWTPAMATGTVYLFYFGLLVILGNFLLGRFVQSLRENMSDGTGLDTGVGMLLGVATGAVVIYAVLCGTQLVTQHVGASNPTFAFQYQKSKVGRFVLTHNIADPEPFPHARVLLALVNTGSNEGASADPAAIGPIRSNPKWIVIADNPEVLASLAQGDWRTLRRDPRLMDLVTDPAFLKASDNYSSPKHKIKAEDPNDRFQELRAK